MAIKTNQQHDRIKKATPTSINKEIENKMWDRVALYISKSPVEISKRIAALEKECDIERYLGGKHEYAGFVRPGCK